MHVRDHARPVTAAIILTGVFVLGGCGSTDPSPTPTDPAAGDATTLQTLIDAPIEVPEFELWQQTADLDGDPAENVTYQSGGFEIHAIIRRPDGGGTGHPAVVLLHGDADPDAYSGLTAYDDIADAFTDAGYVVVAPDMRNHGESDDDPDWATDMGMGQTEDAVNATRATASDPMVDPARIAVIGHSLGGGLALNVGVVAPGSAEAFVAVAPSNISPWVDLEHFGAGTERFDAVVAAHGTPEDSPEYWRDISPATFVDRMVAPLLVVHGTADDVMPLSWSEELVTVWTGAGKEATLVPVEGGDHVFTAGTEGLLGAVLPFLTAQLD